MDRFIWIQSQHMEGRQRRQQRATTGNRHRVPGTQIMRSRGSLLQSDANRETFLGNGLVWGWGRNLGEVALYYEHKNMCCNNLIIRTDELFSFIGTPNNIVLLGIYALTGTYIALKKEVSRYIAIQQFVNIVLYV